MKIIDFGFARLRPQSPAGPMQTPCFTLQYAAPELLAGTLAVLLQFWRRNPLLSIIASTALYMLLLHVF